MSTNEKQVIDRMYAAFYAQNLEDAVATVSEDVVWIHHGSQKLPSQQFEGKSGVSKFFNFFFTSMKAEYFRIMTTIQQDSTVVVTGEEKFFMEGNPEPLAQKWVQIYTVKNGLITRLEEFATSVDPASYQVVK